MEGNDVGPCVGSDIVLSAADIGCEHRGAFARKYVHHGFPETLSGPGDHRDLAVE
jgi:hypothetical protein